MNAGKFLVTVVDGVMYVVGVARSKRAPRADTEARELSEAMGVTVIAVDCPEPDAVDLRARAVPVVAEFLDDQAREDARAFLLAVGI